jgi:hypothetical protein
MSRPMMVFILLLILAYCALLGVGIMTIGYLLEARGYIGWGGSQAAAPAVLPSSTLPPPLVDTVVPEATLAPSQAAATGTPTLVPPTATPLAPPPEYAYISNITPRCKEILAAGAALGNQPNVFSKVGDSITANPWFLAPIGLGQYDLREHTGLQPLIDYFSGPVGGGDDSFARASLAAHGNWRAASVLDPANNQSAFCWPNEMPLVCEYRAARPALALIMLGTNDVTYTPLANYENIMRQIIEISIQRGVIPVVSTIPYLDRAGADVDAYNRVIKSLAAEQQVPLWDYYAAMKSLPNHGLAGDGVHPSLSTSEAAADFTAGNLGQFGATVRNLTALQALDTVWRQCR